MSPAANRARGETLLETPAGGVRLCLTLGALAEMESAFGVADLEALAARLARPSATDLRVALAALVRGGGEGVACDLDAIDPAAAARAIAACFATAFADG